MDLKWPYGYIPRRQQDESPTAEPRRKLKPPTEPPAAQEAAQEVPVTLPRERFEELLQHADAITATKLAAMETQNRDPLVTYHLAVAALVNELYIIAEEQRR